MTEGTQEEKFISLLEKAKELRESPQKEVKPEQLFIYFRLGKEYYAVKLKEVREIAPKMSIYKVPGCQDFLLGVINLRGEIVPVIDLKKRLNLGNSNLEEDFHIVIIKSLGESLGMLVDTIEDIIGVTDIIPEEDDPLLEGKIKIHAKRDKDLKVIGVLYLKKIFFPEEA